MHTQSHARVSMTHTDIYRHIYIYTDTHTCQCMHINLSAHRHAHRDTCLPIYPDTPACTYTRAHSQPMNGLPVGKFLCKSDLIPSSCNGILFLLPQSWKRNKNRKDPLTSIYLEIYPNPLGQNCSSTLLITPHSSGVHLPSLKHCPGFPILPVNGRTANRWRHVNA